MCCGSRISYFAHSCNVPNEVVIAKWLELQVYTSISSDCWATEWKAHGTRVTPRKKIHDIL